MKKSIYGIVIFLSVFICSCKTSSSDGDPKQALSQFMDALSKKDINTARSLATADSKQVLDMMESVMKNDSTASSEYDNSTMQFGEAKVEGDKATVPVKETKSGETINYSLKKEEGKWKVAFDKSTLMTIAMDKMQEKGTNPMDSIKGQLEKMDDAELDTLKKGLKDAMKMIDTMKKN
jgi:hypothetical protein